jgi:signal transduction histidine kinase
MWLRRLSIRWRITIGSVLIGAVLLAAAGVLFHQQVQQAQINSDKKLLYGATNPYLDLVRDHPEQLERPAGEQWIAVIDPDGKTVASNLPEDLEPHMAKFRELGVASHFFSISGVNYLAIVRLVDTPRGTWHVVAVRDQSTSTDVVLQNLTNILLIGGAGLLVGIGAASWVLATLALRPVTLMRRRAETLQAEHSDDLLPVAPARDELSALAITLNGFLTRVRASVARERQMISDASHELRTPIAVAQAQLELADRPGRPAEKLRDDVAAARASVLRLSRIATNLLTLSELDANETARSTTWAELAAEYAGAFDRAQLLASDRQIEIDFDVVDPEGSEQYPVSATDFGRVIDNLVGNAITAVADSERIEVRLVRHPTSFELRVLDTGPGMPAEFLAQALDRFSRPAPDRQRKEGGAGLGLAIVAAIVKRSGGEIAIANREPHGLEVSVRIPRLGG